MSRSVLWGGISILVLMLAGCKGTPKPEENDVWALIEKGEGLKAEEFFRGRVNIDAVDPQGRTPLHAAADIRDHQLAAFLIALGAKPNVIDGRKRTPLGISAEKHDAATAKVLVAAGADIHQVMPNGLTPAEIAVTTDDTVSRNYLDAILTEESVRGTDGKGRTILHLAAEQGNLYAVERILQINSAVLMKADNEGSTALDRALERTDSEPHAETAEALILAGARSAKPLYDVISPAMLKANYDVRLSDGGTPLHYTSREGYTGYMEFFIDQRADVNAKNVSGSTPLHEAVRSGNRDAIGLLVSVGADLDAQDAKGNTPLHLAIPPEVHNQVLELFLSGKANLNLRDEHGETPLHIAVILDRSPKVITALIDGGTDTSIRNIDGKTPLYLAVEEQRRFLIPPLLKAQADIFAADYEGITPLEKALKDKNMDILSALITEQTAIQNDNMGNTPLHIAVEKNADSDVITWILKKGAVVNARNKAGETALHLAVSLNRQTAGEKLLEPKEGKPLEPKADIFALNARGESPLSLSFPPADNPRRWMFSELTLNARDGLGNTALHYMAQWKKDSQIRWLVEEGAPREAANANGETPLFIAAQYDSSSNIKALLSEGALLMARDKLYNTALHTAVRWNKKNAVEALIDATRAGSTERAELVNSQAANGRAPLHEAVQLGYVEIEKILMKNGNGANIEIRDNEGNTPLMEAVKGRSFQSAERLIKDYRADPLTSNVRGDTPLHLAVSSEQEDLIRLFLARGVSIHKKNALGKSPFQLALTRPTPETAARLVSLLLSGEGLHLSDDKGSSPLHIAIADGASHDMVRRILDMDKARGVRVLVSAIDAEGSTPLRLAINRKDWGLAKILTEAGSDVFFSAGDGKNPAELAIITSTSNSPGWEEALEALFTRTTVNNQDTSGNTALHYAARIGSVEVINRLLTQGADKQVKNIAGESPADIAVRWRREQALITLLSG